MKKLLKSKKALSPVIAAIILIAVTVAVSIAVAVWMGSLSFNFMQTEQLSITDVAFTGSGTTLDVTVLNTGTTDVTIADVSVTGYNVTGGTIAAQATIPKGESRQIQITVQGMGWEAGNLYDVELLSTKGNRFTYTATA